jgi:DNA-binding GntR family transcriptional regulator
VTETFRRPPTAQEAVLSELRRAILTGELRPGEQVRQDALAEQFGVSRVPLREALKILEGEGQVTYRPHRGYFVAELDVADLREVYRLRELLETEAVRAAIPRLRDIDVDEIATEAAEVDRAAAAGDVLAMSAANRRLHFRLIEAAQMPRLARLVRILWDATDAYRSLYYASVDHRRAVHEEHQAIVAALQERDVEETVRVLTEHRDHAVAAVTDAVTRRG